MSGKDFAESAEKIKRKKELLRKPVPMLPDAPENIRISKAEFIAKRRHAKEEEIAVEQFKKEFRAIKTKEDGDGVQGKEEKGEEIKKVKMGRPKKIVD